ncbi:hypothetical protein [Rhodospirillum rubrum]|uniref:Flavoprotein domain-containing protein n=1 Tax=Rhodospirillum rubrum (strain ATCC 11170 / ATH 1.1.1 / DSM 467 / LMG 4362 / NCIMB 8255 / S1) TaxID=269796 RepID=Q2RVY3_RHORT|nr:hypothetical protein [Rhodospirillum rubrum]ABC21712.1 hypothetical protein Rru_A0911 [Rhodospirillum rubrum ATCC 11170]AEO47410.1 hypothetical protein F11_04700 [Rhodospirillum rubrum F11]MBK5953265.1 hypothetical protein [Rhodospirillum rubrum]QXG81374.1 flavoprotein [Rhodospirillum rubrum]HAQ01205.1 hypothetical protein [Rhodospirillum rubrum]
MTDQDLEEIITQALIECLADRLVEKLRARQKTALVLFTGTDLGLDKALAALRALREADWTLRFVLSTQARRLITSDRLGEFAAQICDTEVDADADALLNGCARVLVPTLSVTTAAKVAGAIGDSLASRLLTRALERGLPIIGAFDGCCPDNPARLAQGFLVNDAYKARLRANLTALRDYGIGLVPAGRLAAAVLGGTPTAVLGGTPTALIPQAAPTTNAAPPVAPIVTASPAGTEGGKRIFSRSDAVLWRESELRLGRNVLVTPLAVEELRSRNIRLIQA